MIIGNEKLLSEIRMMLRGGRLMHAGILSGPRGAGKKTLAKYLAKAAVCTGAEPPCGRCEGCVKAEKEIHPDIDRVKRERGEITIEQVRSLRASLFTRANEAPRRVAVIEEADRMNRSAQNALLTVLEEPPAEVLLLLLAENEDELLPTIRSRCVRFRMTPLTEEQIVKELMERDPSLSGEAAKDAAGRAGGYLGRAIEWLEGKAESGVARTIAKAAASGDRMGLIRAVLPLEGMKREQIAPVLGELRRILADAIVLQSGAHRYGTSAEERRIAERIETAEILRLSEGCVRLAAYCDANVGTGHIAGALIHLFSEGKTHD